MNGRAPYATARWRIKRGSAPLTYLGKWAIRAFASGRVIGRYIGSAAPAQHRLGCFERGFGPARRGLPAGLSDRAGWLASLAHGPQREPDEDYAGDDFEKLHRATLMRAPIEIQWVPMAEHGLSRLRIAPLGFMENKPGQEARQCSPAFDRAHEDALGLLSLARP